MTNCWIVVARCCVEHSLQGCNHSIFSSTITAYKPRASCILRKAFGIIIWSVSNFIVTFRTLSKVDIDEVAVILDLRRNIIHAIIFALLQYE